MATTSNTRYSRFRNSMDTSYFSVLVIRVAVLELMILCLWLPCAFGDDEPLVSLHVPPRSADDCVSVVRLTPNQDALASRNAAVLLLRLTSIQNDAAWRALTVNAKQFLAQEEHEFVPAIARAEVPLWEFSDLRSAANSSFAIWDYSDASDSDDLIIPEVAGVSDILKGVAVHARADIAEGRIDDALEKLRVGIGVIRHCESSPFSVNKCIQARSMNVLLDQIEELMESEDGQNLYWPLSLLPNPFINVRQSLEWDRSKFRRSLVKYKDSRITSMVDWHSARSRLQEVASSDALIASSASERQIDNRRNVECVEKARMQTATLHIADDVAKANMSEDEMDVRLFVGKYEEEFDCMYRGMYLPPYQGLPLIRAASARFPVGTPVPEYIGLLPDMYSLYADAWRLQQRIDMLRVVEAIRHFAAGHDGAFPESLSSITDLPLPVDIVSGLPFQYEVNGGVVRLTGLGFDLGNEDRSSRLLRIELRLKATARR